ncbi:hypothetical protein [Flavobacterium sp. GT3P67]|uniref:hypothetical protein n=1 Tax=Flavobacterium sp. GT3P67 TaxID=2541722 RepID=UPI001045A74E|nr:hypothetical protein [Flavobacterium sp. GT3P67]TDE53792.1 hypothetical protein E0H99_07180 [Flavobacterium sp. GT3P67]
MKLKKINSEIKKGRAVLLMYNIDKVKKDYPIEKRNREMFEIKQEIERLENLRITKTQNAIAKLNRELQWH